MRDEEEVEEEEEEVEEQEEFEGACKVLLFS